jgi:hydroxyethylthiazole kinase-like uncharacterized protein yjeF
MQRVLSRAQVRDFDRRATESGQVPGLLLMENAGRGAVEAIAALYGGRIQPGLRTLVVCGGGNNGGDGYVVARRLTRLGADVEVLSTAAEDALRGDALANYRAFRGTGGRVRMLQGAAPEAVDRSIADAQLIVDALLGTGLDREVSSSLRDCIERVNRAPARRVALDVPSGLDADTGRVLGAAIRAELTVTFAAHKLGLVTPSGLEHAGRVVVKDIGVGFDSVTGTGESAWLVEASDVARALPPRARSAHKVSAGRVLVIGGSLGKTGAPLLVARGASRAGAGLVTIASWPDVIGPLSSQVLESMTAAIDPERLDATLEPLLGHADVVAIGPGLGLGDAARRLVERVVLGFAGTVVADADALTHFSGRLERLAERAGSLILTPHPGEMGRLLGADARAVEADRFQALARAVSGSAAVVLLKGPHTLIGAPGELPRVGPESTPALATGGAGDVLGGVIAGLACAVGPFTAAWSGAFLHGAAAASWAREHGADRGLLAHEVADRVPATLAEMAGGAAPELTV